MGTECACVVGFVGTARDGDRLEAHGTGELHTEVAKAADAEHRDEVARDGLGLAQRR